ncbi:DUF6789 family protein [Bradyrhizobium sp.]|uniref:DUF6789 family protein n=1 Tax=Bradyrhizobium sp. TaxID=376 RepID=UPI00262BBB5C|nr:DUF6789 family protein [Bradyrhizobium sp.]
MDFISTERIWKSIAAGMCGSLAHGGLMFLKERMGWLPGFQPYQDLQHALSVVVGSSVQPALLWLLSFVNGTLIIGLVFATIYPWLPGRSGAAKGLALGAIGWLAMGLVFFPLLGRGWFASDAGLGLRPAGFSLVMVLAYSVFLGIAYAALDRLGDRGW